MQEINLDSVQAFNDIYEKETLHPLVSVIHVDGPSRIPACVMRYGLYAIFLKETKGCKLSYGRTPYDFDEMTVTSFAPGQVVTVEPNPNVPVVRFTALLFHPDLLHRTSLGKQMSRYEFFGYSSTEALHLSAQEVVVFQSVLGMIEQELQHNIDKHTRELIVSNIELLLNYCLRFYDRQFITREEINHHVVKQFLALVNDYIDRKAQREGLPTVAYFAEQCNLSTGYFGTLVKTEMGRTAKDIISEQLLERSKQLLNDDALTVSMISDRLGFNYPQHFVRFFKAHTGQTPTQYRKIS